jgi:hypothetical protein
MLNDEGLTDIEFEKVLPRRLRHSGFFIDSPLGLRHFFLRPRARARTRVSETLKRKP